MSFHDAQQYVGVLALLLGGAAVTWFAMTQMSTIDHPYAQPLRLNQGRRASDRLELVGGLPQVDADEWPLDEPLPHPAETERRAA